MGNSDSLMFKFTKPPNSIYESLLITPFLWSTSAYERQQQLNVSYPWYMQKTSANLLLKLPENSVTMHPRKILKSSYYLFWIIETTCHDFLRSDPYTSPNYILQYLRFIKSKYPDEEEVEENRCTPFLHGRPFDKGNTENVAFTRAINWDETNPPAAVNICGLQE